MIKDYIEKGIEEFKKKVDLQFLDCHGTACSPVEVNKCFCEVQNKIDRITSFHSSQQKGLIQKVVEMIDGMKKTQENKCSKCSAVLQKNWLPPICPDCFYSDDKSKWDGVKTKEANDQYTYGYNQALSDLKAKLLQEIE